MRPTAVRSKRSPTWRTMPYVALARRSRKVASASVPRSAATSAAERGPADRASATPSRATAYAAWVAMKAAPSSSAPTSGGTMRLDSPWIAVRTTGGRAHDAHGRKSGHGAPSPMIVSDADHNGQHC